MLPRLKINKMCYRFLYINHSLDLVIIGHFHIWLTNGAKNTFIKFNIIRMMVITFIWTKRNWVWNIYSVNAVSPASPFNTHKHWNFSSKQIYPNVLTLKKLNMQKKVALGRCGVGQKLKSGDAFFNIFYYLFVLNKTNLC